MLALLLASTAALAPLQDPSSGARGTEPWLVRQQQADGRWDADGSVRRAAPGDPAATPGRAPHDVRVTALALLSLLDAGNDLTSGPYRLPIRRGFEWLRGQRTGAFGLAGEAHDEQVRDHALATLALLELLSRSHDPEVQAVARGWVNALEFARVPGGGWPAAPGGAADALTTGWALLVLRSAERAGLAVSHRALRDGAAFQRSCFDVETGRVAARPGAAPERLAPTALALLAAFHGGRQPDDEPWLARARAALSAAGPEGAWSGEELDAESSYLGTLAMYLCGGREWEAWSASLKPLVLERFRSADAVLPTSAHEGGGTLGAHGWFVLQVSVYFRYSRLLVR